MARSSHLSRTIDRIAGKAAARIVAPLLNRHRPLPATAAGIAIIQPTAIGDTLIASGCVEAIHRRYPEAKLTIFHGSTNGAAVKMLRPPLAGVRTSFTRPWQALRQLRAVAPDLVVDLTPWPNMTALCARLVGPVAIGFAPTGSTRARFFDIAVPHRSDRHETENLAEMAALFDRAPYAMRIAHAPHGMGDALPVDRLILCHMSAGGSRAADKAWPQANWIALARALTEEGYRIGFTGTPADAPVIAPVLAALGAEADAVSLVGKLGLAELGGLLAEVPLLVTVDTGVLHLAAAVEGRSLGLHGPTRHARWGSRVAHARGLDSAHPGAGYISYGFETGTGPTMDAITVEMVLAAAREMLPPRAGA